MKKLFLVLVLFALSNCEIKVRDSNAGNQKCGDLREIFLINIKDKLDVEKYFRNQNRIFDYQN